MTATKVRFRCTKGAAQKGGSSRFWQLGVTTYLNQILALGLGNERLELRRGEGIHEAGLRDDKQEDLGAGEYGQLVGL